MWMYSINRCHQKYMVLGLILFSGFMQVSLAQNKNTRDANDLYAISIISENSTIKSAANQSYTYFSEELRLIEQAKFQVKSIKIGAGSNGSKVTDSLTRASLSKVISGIDSDDNDVILVFITTHGRRDPSSIWPILELGGDELPLWELFMQLKSKPHRLLVIITQACNGKKGKGLGAAMAQDAPISYTAQLFYQKLFREVQGEILITSSKPGEITKLERGRGGYFNSAFWDEFGLAKDSFKIDEFLFPSWESILSRAKNRTKAYAGEYGFKMTPDRKSVV